MEILYLIVLMLLSRTTWNLAFKKINNTNISTNTGQGWYGKNTF